jgi:hypothetical protein
MCTVREMAERFAAFDPTEAARSVMDAAPEKVLNKNRRQLYEEGIDKDGKALEVYEGSIGGFGGRAYYEEKQRKNPRTASNPSFDLKDTGATYESLTLDFQAEEYSITPHTDYIQNVAGPDDFGLTQQSKEEYWSETLKSGMVDKLAEATGCTTV